MTKTDTILYEALIAQGRFPKDYLEPFVKETEGSSKSLAFVLENQKIISEFEALNILAKELKLAYCDLRAAVIPKIVVDKVSLKVASYYKFMPLSLQSRTLTIAVAYPLDIKTHDEIRMQLGCDVVTALSLSEDIQEALKKHYGLAADTLDKIGAADNSESALTLQSANNEAVEDIEKLASDASVAKLVNQIILEAWKKRATDIHIEPYRSGVYIRYRVDGLLYDANVPQEIKSYLSAIISRIKIMSNLNIVERRLPQDGKAIVRVQEQVLDLRISTIPTAFGESMVIRILPTSLLFSLEKLGLAKRDLQVLEKLIQKPHGVIFVTGPTGSGKTTTLYACLSRLHTRDRKIITIEDPIEYEISGITQIQVMPEIGLDFARGLRSILRHDPDVIMVGEVRDLETAEIAIRVALTGHLVFSTLHTNDAVSGITRLLDIGLEAYLISSSVEAFIAQRLFRVLCQDCKYEDPATPLELRNQIAQDIGVKASEVKVYRGKGCPHCNFSGFWGRAAIYEILVLDEVIKDMVLKKSSSSQLKRVAIARGMRTLRQDGWQKVILGLTTPEEVMKITPLSEDSNKKEEELPSVPKEVVLESPEGKEKRIFQRLDNKVNLKYKIIKSKDELSKYEEHLSVTKNISAGGLLFITFEPIALGSILEVKLELPNEAPIHSLARVVRVEEKQDNTYENALYFLDITSSQRAQLNKYVESVEG